MAAFGSWQREILRRLGAPPTATNLRYLNAWQRAEGGSARYNPLNTTQRMPGSSRYNTAGVQGYRDYLSGIDATMQTLRGPKGNYAPILAALHSGRATPAQFVSAVGGSRWGTDVNLLRSVLAGPVSAYAPPVPPPVYHGGYWRPGP